MIPRSPLVLAAAEGDEDTVVRLLASGHDVKETDNSGRDAVYWCCRAGLDLESRVVDVLVAASAEVNCVDEKWNQGEPRTAN